MDSQKASELRNGQRRVPDDAAGFDGGVVKSGKGHRVYRWIYGWINESWRIRTKKEIDEMHRCKPMCVSSSHLIDFSKKMFRMMRHDLEGE